MQDTTRRTAQVTLPPGMIDLGIGQPAFDLLPLSLMREAAATRLAQGDTKFLNYGFELGDGAFRQALASFLTPHYGLEVDPALLMVTAGASQALDLICTCFTQPGDTVYVEEPSYFLALRLLADHGLRVVGLPVDEDGLVVDRVAKALAEAPAAERPGLLYTIPTFQNPSGATLPTRRREQLVALAQEWDFFIVADEVYHLLGYTAAPPRPLAAHIDSGRVFSLGSFSKILAPGLRLGWAQAAPGLLQRLTESGLVQSGGGLNPFTSSLVQVVLDRGWQEAHLQQLRDTYGRRVATMADALQRHLGQKARFDVPAGGFFFWLELDSGTDSEALLSLARQHGVGFRPGSEFSSSARLRNYLRLSFAFYDEGQIEEGVARLARLL